MSQFNKLTTTNDATPRIIDFDLAYNIAERLHRRRPQAGLRLLGTIYLLQTRYGQGGVAK